MVIDNLIDSLTRLLNTSCHCAKMEFCNTKIVAMSHTNNTLTWYSWQAIHHLVSSMFFLDTTKLLRLFLF